MPPHDHEHRRLVEWLRGEMSRATGGRTYLIALGRLDLRSLRELQRLLRDLDDERQAAIRDARLRPWRR